MENRIRQYDLLHKFWRDKVKRYCEKLEYEVTPEGELNGEKVDIVAEKTGERIAIEIETGKSDAIRNTRKCLLGEFDLVVVSPINKKSENRIENNPVKTNLPSDSRAFVTAVDQLL